MRSVLLALAASLAIATPALANEGRVDFHGGRVLVDGPDRNTLGVAVGYDFDMSPSLFFGVEANVDKILDSDLDTTLGGSLRLGARLSTGKAYVVGGISSDPTDTPAIDQLYSAGAGYEHNVGERAYVKAEYRHVFVEDFNDFDTVGVGVGIRW